MQLGITGVINIAPVKVTRGWFIINNLYLLKGSEFIGKFVATEEKEYQGKGVGLLDLTNELAK